MDVLRILGNPNKEYHKEGKLYLNYLEIGMDIVISLDNKVEKIVMHTNFPYHPHFCFYNRCFFELKLSFEDATAITPFTQYVAIKEMLKSQIPEVEREVADNTFFVRNITSEFSTHFHAYPGIIFEMIVDTDYLASVTIFRK